MSFVASPGSVVALVGASGAGKSTVGRLIERFYDPLEGGLFLDGVDFRRLELRWLRQQIGLVEQEPTLFDRSLEDNIKYGRPAATFDDVRRAARLANAESFLLALPEGYQTKPGEKGVRISGGQKQRIAIARAILKNPAVLLLDEATSALDTANEAVVQAALDLLMEGKTTVVIAHRLSTVVRASQITIPDNPHPSPDPNPNLNPDPNPYPGARQPDHRTGQGRRRRARHARGAVLRPRLALLLLHAPPAAVLQEQ